MVVTEDHHSEPSLEQDRDTNISNNNADNNRGVSSDKRDNVADNNDDDISNEEEEEDNEDNDYVVPVKFEASADLETQPAVTSAGGIPPCQTSVPALSTGDLTSPSDTGSRRVVVSRHR